jgi:two-component system OmpR family sensor kinase
MHEVERLRTTERWIAWVRLGSIPFAVLQVALSARYPAGYQAWAWAATGVLAAGAVGIFACTRAQLGVRARRRLSAAALAFDVAIVSAFVLVYSYEPSSPVRQLLYLPLIEAAVRYRIPGALAVAAASAPVTVGYELLRRHHSAPHSLQVNFVTFQIGVEVIMGLIVGWLVGRLHSETTRAEERAGEAEGLRDELGRRVDLVNAANRCARALGSSLDIEQAFNAFLRELRGLVPFDRVAILLTDGDAVRVMAAAGVGADELYPPGTVLPYGEVVTRILATSQTVYRADMQPPQHPEEEELLALGLRSRLLAPLLIGARTTGIIALVRAEPDAFTPDEIELVTLLGRLVGTTVQNIRSYEAEHTTVEELRRLSVLRADFVSLVSHELRSPMAAVIGSARTLQNRWRELSPPQRESFLALIADETTRLAALIGDVLDTSRIDAGSFSYSFTDVDLGSLVRDAATAAAAGQDEVRVEPTVREPLSNVRGDRERLTQVLSNLIDNAVKYSPAGDVVEVVAYATSTGVRIDVRDRGPGIPREQQQLIFEKFGRARAEGRSKPGTGLGLFIARSIAEAHGGSLDVVSAPGHGATFSLELPAGSVSSLRAVG